MKETGMVHVQTGFVIRYPPRRIVWNFILMEKIAPKKSILQHQSLNCACADNIVQLKKWFVSIIKNRIVNSKHYYCKQKYMDLTCTRTQKQWIHDFHSKTDTSLLSIALSPGPLTGCCPCTQVGAWAAPRPLAWWGASGPQCRLLSLILLLLEIFLTTLIFILLIFQVIYIYTCGQISQTQNDHTLCEDAYFWR